MSAEKSAIEAELRSMGASHPSLWIALFDVNQAIHSSKPLPEMPDWNSVCSTVQDLYRLSLKDPREFAVAQTLTTIMHQQQTKEEILNRVSAIQGGLIDDAPETSERPKESLQLSEIPKKLDALCSKVKELGKAVEDFKNAVEISNKDDLNSSTEPFIIPPIVIRKIASFRHYNSNYSSRLGLDSEWGRQELEKAKAFATSEVSAETIFMLYLMVKNGPIFGYFSYGSKYKSEIEITMEVVRKAYKDAFPFPRSITYQDIRRALEASSIIERVSG